MSTNTTTIPSRTGMKPELYSAPLALPKPRGIRLCTSKSAQRSKAAINTETYAAMSLSR
ncbi:hypothetical protein IF1G_02590 [Cordyceps javanica]|uniref:Uncharacterized protein n=1 Tax=Cordyceps javanica TaxID=43265 RepID=A0A545V9W5_9HYPO|nr:hypothetical protein IF1G_02590 [Cordyceps javanica]